MAKPTMSVSINISELEEQLSGFKLLHMAAKRFVEEFEHSERTSFSEPMDHEDCRRYYEAFRKSLKQLQEQTNEQR